MEDGFSRVKHRPRLPLASFLHGKCSLSASLLLLLLTAKAAAIKLVTTNTTPNTTDPPISMVICALFFLCLEGHSSFSIVIVGLSSVAGYDRVGSLAWVLTNPNDSKLDIWGERYRGENNYFTSKSNLNRREEGNSRFQPKSLFSLCFLNLTWFLSWLGAPSLKLGEEGNSRVSTIRVHWPFLNSLLLERTASLSHLFNCLGTVL